MINIKKEEVHYMTSDQKETLEIRITELKWSL